MEPAHEQSVPTQATTLDNTNHRAGLGARPRTLPLYLLTFLFLAAAVAAFIWYDLRAAYRNTLAYWQARQSSVADNRAHRVSDWLAEREEDAQLIAAHPSVRAALRAHHASRRSRAAQREGLSELTAALDHVMRLHPYAGVYVLDRDAQVVAQSGHSGPLDASLSDACKAVAQAGALRIEVRGDAPDRSHIAFIAPVYLRTPPESSGQTPAPAVGVVLTLLDPAKLLLPLVTQESVATRTGETILVRREGNDLVCFSPLRHVPACAVNMRFPLSAAPVPARLSLEGRGTSMEYYDHRGVPVLAATRSVPPAGWGMVCKIDRAEALVDFHQQVRVETLAGVLLIILLGGLLSFHRREVVTAVLKEEGAKFKALFELAPEAIYMIEPSTLRILARNRKAAEMDGYSDEEVAHMTMPDLHPLEERHLLPHRLENPPESGEALPARTLHHVRKDGKLVPVEERQAPVEVGDQRFWLSIIRDITERKRVQEVLEQAAKRFKLVTSATQDAVFDWDLVSHEIWRNENYQRLFGAPERNLDSDNWWNDRLHPEDRERVLTAQGAAIASGSNLFSPEYRLRRPDGSYADIVERSLIVRDAEGQAVRMIGALTDISERKRAEEALIEEKHLLHTLMDNLPDHIYFKDLQSRFIRVNKGMIKWFGLSDPRQALGMTDFDFFSDEHAQQAYADDQEVIRTGRPAQAIEEKETWPDGHETWVSTTKMPLRDAQGRIIGTFGVSRDITARKRAEAELAERLRFETLLADLSGHFVNVPAEKLDDEIEEALRRVCECLGVEAASLWQASAETAGVIRLTHVYRPPGGPPLPERIDAREYFPWCYQQIVDSKAKLIAVSSLEVLPAAAARDREAWRRLGVKTALVIGLSVGGGTPVGALSFNTMGAERTWSEEIVNRLQLVAEMLSNALARQREAEALRRSEQFNREVISNAQEGVIVHDRDFRILVWNPFMEELTGMPAARVLGKNAFDLFPHLREQNVEPLLRRALAGETVQSHDVPFLVRETSKSGWVSGTYSPHFAPDGEIIGVICIVRNITARKEAEQALRAAEEKFRKAFDACPEPMAIRTLPEGRYLEVNDAFARLAGCPREKIIGKAVTELGIYVNREDLDRMNALIVRDGKVHDYEAPLGWKSKELIHALVSAERIELGGLPCLLLVAKDITERKRAEQELLFKTALLEAESETTIDGILVVDRGDQVLLANRRFSEMWNIPADLIRTNDGKKLRQYVRTQLKDPDTFLERLDYLYSHETERSRDEIAFKDGRVFDRYSSPLHAASGEYYGRIWYFRDITERKRGEEALRQSEERYRGLFENSLEGIGLSKGNRVLNANRALLEIFGYSHLEEFKALPLLEHVAPQSRGLIKEIWAKQDRGEPYPHRFEYQIIRKDGEVRSLEISTERVCVGSETYTQSTFRDITERKQAEEDRVRSLEQLRALAAHLQTIREEERTSVAREIHDQLGQALTAIKLDLSSLAREFTAEQSQQWKRTSSLLKLVDQTIQSVRRISTELRPGMLDDLGLVATVEWAAGEFATRTGTTCRLDLPEEHITLDPETGTAVFRIFQETLTNVARHANASEVNVRLAKRDGDLTLEVHDNGRGITEGEISSAGSLGILGMRERALLLGGEVTVSGEPGKGTTVRVRIPAAYRAARE